VIALAAWRKILKQVNFCDTSELMLPIRRNIFQHIHLFSTYCLIDRWKKIVVIKFMKLRTIFDYIILNYQRKMYCRRILSYKNASYQRKHRQACRTNQKKDSSWKAVLLIDLSRNGLAVGRVCVEKGRVVKVCV